MSECSHARTQIWEPHLAGARKCLDCQMVFNPNMRPQWFHEKIMVEIEFSAFEKLQAQLDEANAKYNFMVGSAQQNARERDEAMAALQDIKSGCKGRAEIFGETLKRCPTCASAETAATALAKLKESK